MRRHTALETLSLYLDEQVDVEKALQIEGHLDECRECRQRLEGLRRVVGGLRSLEPAPPPRGLGLELQRQLARATPPFADRDSMGSRSPRWVLQPAVLGSLGVVLALVVIMLLFLQALQGPGPDVDGAIPETSGEVIEKAIVIVGERRFRRAPTGWIETSLTTEDLQQARRVRRAELGEDLPTDVRLALDKLRGELTLRMDAEVIHVLD